jgi:hypothetical protein
VQRFRRLQTARVGFLECRCRYFTRPTTSTCTAEAPGYVGGQAAAAEGDPGVKTPKRAFTEGNHVLPRRRGFRVVLPLLARTLGLQKKAVLRVLYAPAFWPRPVADSGNPFQLQLLHLNNVRPLFSGLLLISRCIATSVMWVHLVATSKARRWTQGFLLARLRHVLDQRPCFCLASSLHHCRRRELSRGH